MKKIIITEEQFNKYINNNLLNEAQIGTFDNGNKFEFSVFTCNHSDERINSRFSGDYQTILTILRKARKKICEKLQNGELKALKFNSPVKTNKNHFTVTDTELLIKVPCKIEQSPIMPTQYRIIVITAFNLNSLRKGDSVNVALNNCDIFTGDPNNERWKWYVESQKNRDEKVDKSYLDFKYSEERKKAKEKEKKQAEIDKAYEKLEDKKKSQEFNNKRRKPEEIEKAYRGYDRFLKNREERNTQNTDYQIKNFEKIIKDRMEQAKKNDEEMQNFEDSFVFSPEKSDRMRKLDRDKRLRDIVRESIIKVLNKK